MALLFAAPQAQSRSGPRITTPKEQFGRNIGDDYFLVNWTQWVEYLQKMDRESDRMSVVEIGKTAEGRTQYTAIITSPANHRRLAQLKDMNRRLALADGLTDDQARQVAQPELSGDLVGCFEICPKRRVFDIMLAGRPAGVDIDRNQRFGLVDHHIAA